MSGAVARSESIQGDTDKSVGALFEDALTRAGQRGDPSQPGPMNAGDKKPATDDDAKPIQTPPSSSLDDLISQIGGGRNPVDRLEADGTVAFERDTARDDKDVESTADADQNVIKGTLEELLANDPEFKEAFDKAKESGMRFQFRFNADETQTTQINGDVLQIDIKPGDNVADALKDTFSADSNWAPKAPGEGPSFEEVMADDGLSGEAFVENMERLNLFSFSGEHGDKIRKDVIYMYDNSAFMKETMRSTLQEHDGEKAFNFSTIGEGGGTISTPFNDLSTSVTDKDAYEGISTEDYKPGDHLPNVELMAHEMVHSFLGVGDTPAMDVAEKIFAGEIRESSGSDGAGFHTRIGYQDDQKDATFELSPDFDVKGFMEDARGGGLDDKTPQEILDTHGGGTIGLAALEDDKAFDDALNGLVETVRSGVDVDNRTTLYMEGDLGKQYKQLLDYNLRNGDFDNWEDLSKATKEQFLDRLGNSNEEADVFEGYLEHHGGNEQLDNLASSAWNENLDVPPPAFSDKSAFDDGLNGLVESIRSDIDVDKRQTPYIEGDLAEQYKELLEYNQYHGNFESAEALNEYTQHQLMERLGNSAEEADVFSGYLERWGGNEQLNKLADDVWNA